MKFKIGDEVVITAERDHVTRHYHPIGAVCSIVDLPDAKGCYKIKCGTLEQWATSACFKLKTSPKLENK